MSHFEIIVFEEAVYIQITCPFFGLAALMMCWSFIKVMMVELLDHLNSRRPSIKFTIEKQENNMISFFDILIKQVGSFALL